MSSILDAVVGAIDQNTIHAAARQLGTSPQQAQGAIEAALPLLIGGLGRNASTAQGAQALHRALERDHANSDPMAVLGQMLGGLGGGASGGGGGLGDLLGGLLGGNTGGGGGGLDLGAGAAILGHLFGDRQTRVQQGLGAASGLNMQQSAQLLQMLAPLVMSVLGNQTRQRGLDAGGLSQVLGHDMQRMQSHGAASGLLGAVLDRDGDGDVDFADLAQGANLLGTLFGRR